MSNDPRSVDEQYAHHIEPYPEHVKLHAVQDKSQVIGEFIEWCEDVKGLEWSDDTPRTDLTLNQLLAEFFGIDYTMLMAEKEAMYASLIAMQGDAHD